MPEPVKANACSGGHALGGTPPVMTPPETAAADPASERPIGTIAQVHGPVVDIRCSQLPPLHQALSTALDGEKCLFEVHRHLDEQHVRAITLHRTSGTAPGHASVRHWCAAACAGRARLPGAAAERVRRAARRRCTARHRNVSQHPRSAAAVARNGGRRRDSADRDQGDRSALPVRARGQDRALRRCRAWARPC